MSVWEVRQSEKRMTQAPSATLPLKGLALMSSLKSAFPPPVPQVDFSVVARTAVQLPAGRYRFEVTSDDGVRLYVDGNRVIDAWSVHLSRLVTADVNLSAPPHELRAEYFQAGGPYKLWVRIEPLDGPGIAKGTARGTHAGAGPKN